MVFLIYSTRSMPVWLDQDPSMHNFSSYFAAFTETLFDRLELRFGFNQFDLHALRKDIMAETTVDIVDELVHMYNLNARLALLKEGEIGPSRPPP